ncbi:MAG TPA: hypothetical protein VGN27_10920 [Gaiellaceae bacterium]|jgi:hypothetical protein|nr:hypothetical protein [Gaiellaceae bacterium]
MRNALALVGSLSLLLAAGAGAATAPDVSKLILRGSQVGPGYLLFQRSDGHGVKTQVTLNLCGTDYPSEARRVTRLQTNYLHRNTTLGISNEVVTYRSGGAAQAMQEVARHVDGCPHRPIDSGVKGLPKLLFEMSRVHDAHLLKGYVAVRIKASGTIKGKHLSQVSYAVYQRRGDVLSGVYSFGPAGSDAAQRRLCLHAAEQSAANLLHGGNSPGGPTA